MTEISTGSKAPNFSLPGDGGTDIALGDYAGQNLVLYFYPRDDTPGCTKEAIGFTEKLNEFAALNTQIVGVSKDTVAKHDKFISKHDLGVRLISDEEGSMLEDYGVWVEKKNYGRTYMGIERSTYLIGPDEGILQIWRKVRVKDHVEKVLEAVKAL